MLFKDLSSSAKIVYHVTRRIKNHKTDSFFHSSQKIADIAGISLRSCQYALDELVQKGILKETPRPGHTSLYTFISTADLDPCRICTPDVQNLHPTPAEFAPITTSALTNSDLTTTVTWLNDSLKDQLIKQYGLYEVEKRVVVISKMNGKIKNKAGLLRHSLINNYIPTCKELQEKEEQEQREAKIQAKIEAERIERLKMFEKMEEQKANINISEMFQNMLKNKSSHSDLIPDQATNEP